MKKLSRILMLSILSMLILGGVLWAEERVREGALSGTFVRLAEREVGEWEYMGIVIKPHDRDDHVILLVPRKREELLRAARRLREGQKVGVSFVTEAGQMWIKGLEAEWREVIEERQEDGRRMNVRKEVFRYEDSPERRMSGIPEMRESMRPEIREPRRPEINEPRRPERRETRRIERREPRRPEYFEQMQELKRLISSNLDRMAREFRELRNHIEELERELHMLRDENERLRRELRRRVGPEREHEEEVRIRIQREHREPEERERSRERNEGRARGEQPMTEREVALHQLEVMRMALEALREAERGDAAELLTLAIRSREMMLEGRRDEEAQRLQERAPKREQLAEILSLASKLWREFGHAEKSVAVGRLAGQFSASRDRDVREQEEREVRRRRELRRDDR